ncbi:MAG: hypothetical protein IIA59_09280 [Candidatus Marinimicrobia bacterium]|nr:hypothetical protein [Candidatus Neomarinimicrobiota bacterium]
MAGFRPIRRQMDGVKNQAMQGEEASQDSDSSQFVTSSVRQVKESNSSDRVPNLESFSGLSGMVREVKIARITEDDSLSEIVSGGNKHAEQSLHNPGRALTEEKGDKTNPVIQGDSNLTRRVPPPIRESLPRSSVHQSMAITSIDEKVDGNRMARAAVASLERDAHHDHPTKPRNPAKALNEEKAGPPTINHPPASIVSERGAVTSKLVLPEHDERTFVAEALTRIPDHVHGWDRHGERPSESNSIEVIIDSIEIVSQTVQPSTEPVASYEPAAPALSLDSYLQQRDEGTL